MFTTYSTKYLATLLGITETDFHRLVKPIIKADFKEELAKKGFDNPNIGLNQNYKMYLVNSSDPGDYNATDVSIFDYI